jgi:type I restriction enzyme S subunit
MIQVPDGWEINNFKDLKIKLIDGDRGENYPKENEFSDNGFCVFLSAKNVTKDGFRFNEIQFIEKDKDEKLRKGKLNKNDIVLTTRGTVGNIAYFDNTIKYNHIRINSGMILLRNENKTLETNYLHIFLKSNIFDNQISNTVFGSAQPQLTVKEIEKFFICFPKEKKEQEKIAKILSTLDNAIESTNRIIEKEKNIKTALMQELLTNGIDKNGQIRTPQTHTYKQSELGLVPDEWEVKALKSVGSCKNGLTYSPDDIVESDGVLVLRSSNIKNNKLTFSDNVFVREDMKVNYKVQENDILICVRNGSKNLIGKNALITRESINMAHGAFMTVFHSNINEYVFQLFQSDLFFKQVEKNLGATINSINNSDLLLFDFSFPKDEIEQKQITKILTTQDEKIEIEEKNLAKLKELKKGLMNDLLSGVVRVKV